MSTPPTATPNLDDDSPGAADATPLARRIGLGALIVYGVGDMLGAGIYGLVGKAAGQMGNAVWLAFAGSMVAAGLTGLSYASLGSRHPRAAGAAYITHRAYRRPVLAYVVGLAVAASGLTSMATGANVLAGYAGDLAGLPADGADLARKAIVVAFLFALAGVVFRGIRESVWLNAVCTAVELLGLVVVIAVGARYWGSVNYLELPPPPPGESGRGAALVTLLVMQGAVLTFFSFIGFEDILNVAEEVKEPRRTIPIGLIAALGIATVVYMAVSITAVSVVPYADLAASKSPLVDVVTTAAPWFPAPVFAGVAIFAVANTALLNYVMGSRLLYGMSRQGLLPAALGRVHPTRRTPHVAVAVLLAVVLVLALTGGVAQLATATSLLLLAVFVVVNVALLVLQRRPGEPPGGFEVPAIVPALGAVVCASLIAVRVATRGADGRFDYAAPLTAGLILAAIVVLYAVIRPEPVADDPIVEDEHAA